MIIPIFIMNRGCRHRCLFCNEELTADNRPERLEEAGFRETVRTFLSGSRRRGGPVEIAFYGGTFTGMPREEQERLLGLAAPYLREGRVDRIRISTRPDDIGAEGLDLLETFGVRTVEIGAQSLDDDVLRLSHRGHRAADTLRAVSLLKERGFATGIHLMAGLPGDSRERFARTVDGVIALCPDTVRIHPTIVLRDTLLADAYRTGGYMPLTLPEAVSQCKDALKKLRTAGISVIRMGLQATRGLEAPGAVVAGPFHPAFGSLIASALFLDMATALCESSFPSALARGKTLVFTVSSADLFHLKGPRKANIAFLEERFEPAGIRITADPTLPRWTLILTAGSRDMQTDGSGRITELRRNEVADPGFRALSSKMPLQRTDA